jgi:CheY-like chemotaxis protein
MISPARPPSILVADADADTRAFYRHTLGDAGYDVEEAPDGRDALAKAFVRPSPTAIVTEINLPKLTATRCASSCGVIRRQSTFRFTS